MNRFLSNSLLVVVLAAAFPAAADEALKVEIGISRGRTWIGDLTGREGDWLEFREQGKDNTLRIGAGTVDEIRFNVELDIDALQKMLDNREFKPLIALMTQKLAPFAKYNDIPSNLAKYQLIMVKLYYWDRQYGKSLAIADILARNDRDEQIRDQSRIYQTLDLIDSGDASHAEELLAKYGWADAQSKENGAEQLFLKAKLLALKKEYGAALETVAKVVAFHGDDAEWMPPAELLCARLYAAQGFYDSTDEVIREILLLYKDTPEFDDAKTLQTEVERLRAAHGADKQEEGDASQQRTGE